VRLVLLQLLEELRLLALLQLALRRLAHAAAALHADRAEQRLVVVHGRLRGLERARPVERRPLAAAAVARQCTSGSARGAAREQLDRRRRRDVRPHDLQREQRERS
jgi:hypothetical protein